MQERTRPCVLLLAGLDPSGGAGLAADQRGVLAAGAWPCPVTVLSTVQSTAGLRATLQVSAEHVHAQASAVLQDQDVRTIKTGALGASGARLVLELMHEHPRPLVVDPVLGATHGRAPLTSDRDALLALLSHTTLVTPNTQEAEALCGSVVRDRCDQREAALTLVSMGASAALVKGGHLQGRRAIDVLAVGARVFEIGARRREVGEVHGTGCLLASLVAGRLAMDETIQGVLVPEASVLAAVRFAKRKLAAAMDRAMLVGRGQRVLLP